MKRQRQSLDEKKELVKKVDDLLETEKIGIKEACSRLNVPYWKYHAAMMAIKGEKEKAKSEDKASSSKAKSSGRVGELKVELAFRGEAAKLIREYADQYGVEPEVVCRIMVIDALSEKRKPFIR